MNQICRDIFRAIHEGKWLKIEYRNKADQVTKYWIGIRDLDPRSRTMKVDGLHLGQFTIGEYDRIFIDSILSTEIIEGTYCPENRLLVEDIEMHPERYKNIFDSSANLKILNYLEICNKLDTTPYITDYDLIHYIDRERINCGMYQLTDQQFREVVAQFQYFSSREKRKSGSLKVKRLAINVLSINTNKGLYVLAYRNLNLDVKNHIFKPDEEITVCTQFSIDGKQENARKFLDADEYELLEDFEKNLEKIKDAITEHGGNRSIVDDMPYVIGLGMDIVLNLHEEYKAIVPIIRGEKLMLVGDPQQLNPVILLGELTNKKLRRRYHVSDEYDYRENSIYKTYLACDAVSDEVLLRNHYRCNKEIIGFNNKKYYNSKLKIQSKSKEPEPLVYMDVKSDNTQIKNTSPAEVEEVVEYALLNKDKSIAVITPFVNQKQLIENAIKQNKLSNLVCGTVHAFQGDEKDVVLFSTAISERTSSGTYNWLKNNKELINVATSRAKEKLVLLTNGKELERLHAGQTDDDLYELAQYIKTNGHSKITEKHISSRALGIQPFSTATENAFLENLTHALENIWLSQSKYVIHKEVAISQVFRDNITYDDLFYMGRFDFVVYEKQGRSELPILAIELDGKEHFEDAVVKERDRKKNAICKAHNMEIIRVENSYARRYNHIKGILMDYFSRVH